MQIDIAFWIAHSVSQPNLVKLVTNCNPAVSSDNLQRLWSNRRLLWSALVLTSLGWEIFGVCVLLFCQNERIYFLSVFIFQFLNNKMHNYVKQNVTVHFIIQKVYKLRKLRKFSFWQNKRKQKPDISHLGQISLKKIHCYFGRNYIFTKSFGFLMIFSRKRWKLYVYKLCPLWRIVCKNSVFFQIWFATYIFFIFLIKNLF